MCVAQHSLLREALPSLSRTRDLAKCMHAAARFCLGSAALEKIVGGMEGRGWDQGGELQREGAGQRGRTGIWGGISWLSVSWSGQLLWRSRFVDFN